MNRTVRGRIGIITGSGPDAGVDLWQKVLAHNRRAFGQTYRGDVDAPDVTIASVPELGWSMDLPRTESVVWSTLRETVERLATQVDAYAIACNTLYVFEEQIRNLDLDAQLISPVECVRNFIADRSISSAAVLGAAPVTDLDGGSPYATLAEVTELEVTDDPARLHRLIEEIKVAGVEPHLNDEFRGILEAIRSEVALLACTELPLLDPALPRVELVDINQLMAQELVAASMGRP